MTDRRRFLLALAALAAPARAAQRIEYPVVVPGHALQFPADFGAHLEFRTEWWYITGWVGTDDAPLGIQITFFRHRPGIAEGGRSRFAPTQLLFAHAAVADPGVRRLRHDQRSARAGFDLAQARTGNTDVHIADWSLRRENGRYHARIAAREFDLDLAFEPTQPPLLQGDTGYSRKGAGAASYYYSEPQLAVSGRVGVEGRSREVSGRAWLDHEWSSEYLPQAAAGWDWTGIDFDDGSALMAFLMRAKAGGALWASATLRDARGAVRTFGPGEVRFTPRRTWRSPRTQATWPVAMTLEVGDASYALEPLFDDQELDSRASTGTVYWEGAVRALDGGKAVGRGYLELTGYAGALRI